ncbi:MAG TPA: ROK family transcriptional regulator [Clostridiaceae bacterium]|nr:ROK family transcriptional regulator [Clostridiaceae bacterium]
MVDKGITSLNVKVINRNKVYNCIYKEVFTSKQQIANKLQMGISTVSQNIKSLEKDGLIERNGNFDSTGGRRADIIQIVRNARVAIGVGILKKYVFIVAVDLYGEIIHSVTLNLPYESSRDYYKTIGDKVDEFIRTNQIKPESILGVSIATQGIISSDGQSVSYGVIMGNHEMKLSSFTEFIPYPCRLEHDCKAAAYLELWKNKDIENAVVFLLNRNLGGSFIINRRIFQGVNMHGGALEHLCINKDGPLCYCGNRGCLETYCSANTIENASGMEIQVFFENLRKGVNSCVQIWTDYLDKLAFAIRNLSIIIDGHIIISGYLAPFFTEDDISYILRAANSPPFPIERDQILVGTYGQYTPAAGAALHYLDEFLQTV